MQTVCTCKIRTVEKHRRDCWGCPDHNAQSLPQVISTNSTSYTPPESILRWNFDVKHADVILLTPYWVQRFDVKASYFGLIVLKMNQLGRKACQRGLKFGFLRKWDWLKCSWGSCLPYLEGLSPPPLPMWVVIYVDVSPCCSFFCKSTEPSYLFPQTYGFCGLRVGGPSGNEGPGGQDTPPRTSSFPFNPLKNPNFKPLWHAFLPSWFILRTINPK